MNIIERKFHMDGRIVIGWCIGDDDDSESRNNFVALQMTTNRKIPPKTPALWPTAAGYFRKTIGDARPAVPFAIPDGLTLAGDQRELLDFGGGVYFTGALIKEALLRFADPVFRLLGPEKPGVMHERHDYTMLYQVMVIAGARWKGCENG